MKKLADLSIRTKLTLIVMAAICAVLLVSSAALAVYDQFTFGQQMQRHAAILAEVIGNNSTAALSFGDARAAGEILEALRAEPHLGGAVIFDADGKELARYARPGWSVPLILKAPANSVEFWPGHLEVFHPVSLNGQRIGTILLQTDLEELHERRNDGLATSLAVLLAAAGFGFLLARRLVRSISQPILRLAETSETIAAEKNYGIRVPKHSEDELGKLIDGFNNMLSQIQARDTALQTAHVELEGHVAERTRQLFISNTALKEEVDAHRRARDESDALRQKLQTAFEHLEREAEERAHVQEALRRSEERFSKAFRANPVPLAILTRGSRAFVDVNDRFAELVGRKRDVIIGDTMFSLALWSESETRARIERLLADGQPLRNWECRIIGAGQQNRTALLSAETFMLGSESCVLLMTEDISDRVSLEGQLRHAQKMEAVGQLASGVAHDFNNLLTIIQGYVQLILAGQSVQGVMREALEKVTGATQRASQLTRQLLTFSRKQVAQPKPLDLNQVINNVTTMLRPLLGENVRLKLGPGDALPLVDGDTGMLEQVLINLAVNARDAMATGGELIINTFGCEIDESYLRCRPQAKVGRFVCLQVSDSGCGIDAATLDRIFEPFFTTKGVGKGTGLGLATVYGIVKQHQGWIEVASQVGVGTTFKIFLPVAQSAVTQPESKGELGVNGGHETILVVEDEPALRELVTTILRTFGYHVLEASHGKDALEVWQRARHKPVLLLTDMMMPEGMTGSQLAERLRGEAPRLKVVYTSGYSPELFGSQLPSPDRENFLPKPFHPRLLARTVRRCLDN